MQPVDGLNSPSGQRLPPVGQQPQRLQLTVHLQHAQPLGSDRHDRDRVGIQRDGLGVWPVSKSLTLAASFAGTSTTFSPDSNSR